jgi:hypothetical protein
MEEVLDLYEEPYDERSGWWSASTNVPASS